jgi:hypothetical protein
LAGAFTNVDIRQLSNVFFFCENVQYNKEKRVWSSTKKISSSGALSPLLLILWPTKENNLHYMKIEKKNNSDDGDTFCIFKGL